MNINGVSIAAFALAMTQAIKNIFGVEGKWNQVVALCIAVTLTAISQAVENNLFSPGAMVAIEIVVTALVGGLSAIGLFDLGKQSWEARTKTVE